MRPSISVIIPVHNGEKTLKECLCSVQAQLKENDEIIVIDDGSVDRSAEIVDGLSIKLIRQTRQGQSSARNKGIRAALGDIVVFTDADCTAASDWLDKLAAPIAAGDSAGTVGRIESHQKNWVASLIQIELDERYSQMQNREVIDFLNTGNCAFRKELLTNPVFDESFLWLEDVELSFRLSQKRHRMIFVESAVVEHPHPESFWQYLVRKFRYAVYAPTIYRRYPSKVLSDSRTPRNRKLQLFLLGLGFLFGLGFLAILFASNVIIGRDETFTHILLLLALGLIGCSILFSLPLVARAWKRSVKLGLIAPVFVLAGNIAFLAGTAFGLLAGNRNRFQDRSSM
jgi:glycosyltransferase involved in cell wall biosynthesis